MSNINRIISSSSPNYDLKFWVGIYICRCDFGRSDNKDAWLNFFQSFGKCLSIEIRIVVNFNAVSFHFLDSILAELVSDYYFRD